MLRGMFFVGIGLLIGGSVAALVGPPGAAAWAIATGLAVAVASGVLVIVGRSLKGVQLVDPKSVQAARDSGRIAVARIDALRQTGTQINDQPLCEIELTVQPHDAPAFRTRLRDIVPITEIPRVQPGQRRLVALLTPGGPEIALLPDALANSAWADTIVPAASAAGELLTPDGSVVRPDGSRRGPLIRTDRAGRPLRIVLFALVTALVAAAVVLPYRAGFAQTLTALQHGQLRADMRDPEPLAEALSALRDEIGHDQLVSALVTREFVIVEAPVAPGTQETDAWMYRGGVVEHRGAASIQPQTPLEAFPMSDVRWSALGPAVSQASADSGIAQTDDVSFSVGRGADSDVHSDTFAQAVGPVAIRFSIADDYRSVFYSMDADGTGFAAQE